MLYLIFTWQFDFRARPKSFLTVTNGWVGWVNTYWYQLGPEVFEFLHFSKNFPCKMDRNSFKRWNISKQYFDLWNVYLHVNHFCWGVHVVERGLHFNVFLTINGYIISIVKTGGRSCIDRLKGYSLTMVTGKLTTGVLKDLISVLSTVWGALSG